ncbi:ATP-dependent RNA helicase HrpA [Motiliproteus sp. MSK22-1]|uniref:ATP-dependent RNA helicase HrpA n=1 Tax=Motiliproteus sp. MSK22-1 TaxID=1897630 RepID=UPI000976A163|nr:ATP-dependent RNA helicase HrpA [Motiliproteus sp. MSK22-1]OMH39733.1 ATP-dependent RNA helicase HrpA [Motiliproteus sp. MSK22-1]
MNSAIEKLNNQIDHCLIADRQELKKILAAIKRNQVSGKPFDRLLKRFEDRVSRSAAAVERRSSAPLSPNYDDDLPICSKRTEIISLIDKHQVVILAGETGSGKTTQLPKFCLELGRGRFGLIGHTQPRRLAARAVANRIAEELQVELGSMVGYQVRFSDALGEQSRVKLMTDGILLAEIQHDPLLLRYDTLIIDEAHERSLNIDFLLGYLKRMLPRRPDLKLIITSATIDLERFSNHFDKAPIIEVSGRTYPVEVIYRPLEDIRQSAAEQQQEQQKGQEKDLDLQQAIVHTVTEIELLEKKRGVRQRGDVLIFLSGERDIRETADALRKQKLRDTEILPLYARLSSSEQNRIFRPTGKGRRIVLATNVAETSLTVPGIRYVIDPGFARISRYSYRSKVQRLPIEPVSRASANQRKGRCGRVAEGICIRLYSEDDFTSRPAFTDAEILRTNLAAVILQMENLKLGPVEEFPFIDPPDSRFVKDGVRLLQELGALDSRGRLTKVGKQLSKLPVDPRIGRMIIEAEKNQCLSDVQIIASALSVQDPRERPLDKQQQADEKHRIHTDKDSDFIGFLNLWNAYELQRQQLSNGQLRSYCRKNFLAFMRMREWRDLHRQLHLACKDLGFSEKNRAVDSRDQSKKALSATANKNTKNGDRTNVGVEDSFNYSAIHKSLLSGLLSHVGVKQENREYLGARNRKFMVFPGSVLSKGKAKWIMAAELVETTKLYARCVAKIDPRWLESLGRHLVKKSYSEPHWERKPAQVVAYEQQSLYGLPIVSRRKVHYGAIDPQESQQIFIRSALVEGDFQTRAPFFEHNRALISEIEALEDKSRRRDIVVDEEQLYEFYRQKLIFDGKNHTQSNARGDKVVNGASFEQWRKCVEQEDPKALFLTRDQLMQHDATTITQVQYPDSLDWEGMSFRLSYRFEPGAGDDGVTISVPVGALNLLPQNRLEWLVPGMLKQKCIAMLKLLPKAIRKNFVPIPDYVDAFLDAAIPDDTELTQALSQSLRRMTGVLIPVDSWNIDALEEHHKMRILVLDEDGESLSAGRNWQALFKQFGNRTIQPAKDESGLERVDIKQWDFGSLPQQAERSQAGMKITVYPALALDSEGKDSGAISNLHRNRSSKAKGESLEEAKNSQYSEIGIRIFSNSEEAAASHKRGVVRLLQLQLGPQISQLRKKLPHWQQSELLFAKVGNKDALWQDFLDAVVERTFLQQKPLPRTKEQFSEALSTGKGSFIEQGNLLAIQLYEIMSAYHKLKKSLSGTVSLDSVVVLNDIKSQLSHLVFVGFLSSTPPVWLNRYSFYLKAVELRLEKYQRDLNQQRFYSEQLTAFWQRYEKLAEVAVVKAGELSARETYRWMLEEYRISLFAQQLGTVSTISSKRLDKLWRECQ